GRCSPEEASVKLLRFRRAGACVATLAMFALLLCTSFGFAQPAAPPPQFPDTPNNANNPQPPLTLGPTLPAPGPAAPRLLLNVAPRSASPFQVKAFQMPSGEQVIVVSGGVLLTVRNVDRVGVIDIEAEQLVFWTRGDSNNALSQMQS